MYFVLSYLLFIETKMEKKKQSCHIYLAKKWANKFDLCTSNDEKLLLDTTKTNHFYVLIWFNSSTQWCDIVNHSRIWQKALDTCWTKIKIRMETCLLKKMPRRPTTTMLCMRCCNCNSYSSQLKYQNIYPETGTKYFHCYHLPGDEWVYFLF